MKYLSLQQAMLGMRVVMKDTGVLLKSPAGTAEYNRKGRRIKVNGHADYFPEYLRVKDKRTPKGGYVSLGKDGTTVFNADGSVRLRLGCFDKTPIQSDERLMKCNDATEPFAVNEGQQFSQTVEFKADRFAIHENAQSIIDNAIANHKTNAQVDSRDNSHVMNLGHCVGNTVTAWRLSGQMHEAIINAVAESDLFKSLVSSVDAQAASIAGLQQAIPDAVNEAIRNALKPGGLLWSARSRGI